MSSTSHPQPQQQQALRSSSSSTQPTTTTSSTTPQPKVNVQIDPTSHLDPGAYVRGTHPIRIGAHVVVHPRAHLLSIHGPLTIGDGCIVGERCVLGGPVPSVTTAGDQGGLSGKVTATVVQENVYLHPASVIWRGVTVGRGTVVESTAEVLGGCVVGEHVKVAAGMRLGASVDDWTVVWGGGGAGEGDQGVDGGGDVGLRRRNRRTGVGGLWECAEAVRLENMKREREGMVKVLRAAAAGGSGGARRR